MKYSDKSITLVTPIIRTIRRMGLIPPRPLINDRAIEYGFAFKHLKISNNTKVLDVGYLESPIPFELEGLGADVYALDIRKCPISYPNIKFIVGDIRSTKFEDGFFDYVLAISTLEHLGLSARYGSYEDQYADEKAMDEIKRILKPKGIVILTMPFGIKAVDSVQRTYDKKAIANLVKDFDVIDTQYSLKKDNNWRLAKYNEVKDITGYNSNILLALKKKS